MKKSPRKNSPRNSLRAFAIAAAATCLTGPLRAEPIVKDGDVVEIIGDSITEGRQYSAFIEDYLLLCQPAKVRTMQFGWSGENVAGLNARMADFLAMKPTVVTLCYGMNDGRYRPINDEIRGTYHAGLEKAVKALQAAGAKVVVGSPGCVDSTAFVRPDASAAVYNVNLAALRDEAADVAKSTGSPFADVYQPMFDALTPAKARYGNGYSVAGGDGVHPRASGGVAMAYAILKGMGFDGDIGTIKVDLAAHAATVTGRHEVVGAKSVGIGGDAITLNSTAYPICFPGEPKDPGSPAGLLDFVPFNADLNRLMLVADGGSAAKYKVTWGKTSKEFTADQLKAGINLAAEFRDNPFMGPFLAVHQKVMQKQGDEIQLLKQLLRSVNAAHTMMPEHDKDLDAVASGVPVVQTRMADAVAKAVVPVTHTITLESIHD